MLREAIVIIFVIEMERLLFFTGILNANGWFSIPVVAIYHQARTTKLNFSCHGIGQ